MITERATFNNLRFLDISTDACTASLCLQGAHLTSWKPANQEHDCLFLSPDSPFEPGKAIRGGIPICWPWFGKREDAPSHGIARTSEWTLDHVSESPETAHIILRLLPADESMPAAFLRLTLGQALTMSLQTTARRHPCKLTGSFHNYFHLGDVRQCRVAGLGDAPYEEFAVQAGHHTKIPLPLTPHSAIDRVYDMSNQEQELTLEDHVLRRKIRISRQGAASIVIWNPWEEGSRSIGDLTPGTWQNFLCVETANALDNIIRLEPGHTHTLSQTITVEAL